MAMMSTLHNLQPLEAYLDITARVWHRQAWVVGVPFGAAMGLASAWSLRSHLSLGGVIAFSLVASVVGGAGFGFSGRDQWRALRVE